MPSHAQCLIPFALALLFLPPARAWADIAGQPRVIDGDTLEVAGQRIRLHGIDAPENLPMQPSRSELTIY